MTESTTVDLFVEETHSSGFSMKYKIKTVLYSEQSKFQHVSVVDTVGHGKMLLNDGLVMVTERDEFVYHDMIAHVPLFTHPNPKNVLIIGGGDGGTAREVLRHKSVETCTMVEIDEKVVEASRLHIPQTSCELDNPRLNLLIEDGVHFLKNTNEKFDVILVDSTEPFGPATPLFNIDFYRDVFNSLTENGIVVSQGESCFYESESQNSLLKILHETFPVVSVYNYSNLTYPGGLWSFTFASKGLSPVKDFDEDRILKSDLKFQYYNKDIHRSAFCLPQFMQNSVKEYLKG